MLLKSGGMFGRVGMAIIGILAAEMYYWFECTTLFELVLFAVFLPISSRVLMPTSGVSPFLKNASGLPV